VGDRLIELVSTSISAQTPAIKTSANGREKGPSSSRTSSRPSLASKVSSVALKTAMDPSAPPPLIILIQH
jgi:hypothetical protein